MKSAINTGLAVLMSVLLVACSSGTRITSDMQIKGAPDWVNEGTQAVKNKDGRLIHGMGEAPSMGDSSLQKSTADNRARAEIARVLSTVLDDTYSEYTSSTGGEADGSVARALNSSTQQALSGARILGHWKDKKTGIVYALAELDTRALDKALATSNTLSENFRMYYEQNAGAGFDRFMESAQ